MDIINEINNLNLSSNQKEDILLFYLADNYDLSSSTITNYDNISLNVLYENKKHSISIPIELYECFIDNINKLPLSITQDIWYNFLDENKSDDSYYNIPSQLAGTILVGNGLYQEANDWYLYYNDIVNNIDTIYQEQIDNAFIDYILQEDVSKRLERISKASRKEIKEKEKKLKDERWSILHQIAYRNLSPEESMKLQRRVQVIDKQLDRKNRLKYLKSRQKMKDQLKKSAEKIDELNKNGGFFSAWRKGRALEKAKKAVRKHERKQEEYLDKKSRYDSSDLNSIKRAYDYQRNIKVNELENQTKQNRNIASKYGVKLNDNGLIDINNANSQIKSLNSKKEAIASSKMSANEKQAEFKKIDDQIHKLEKGIKKGELENKKTTNMRNKLTSFDKNENNYMRIKEENIGDDKRRNRTLLQRVASRFADVDEYE